jgi:hypothetical protein
MVGNPHIITFDDQIYSFDAAGEFLLAGSNQPGDTFFVQARFQPFDNSAAASAITQVAALVGSDRITVGVGRDSPVWVDGSAATLSLDNPIQLAGGLRAFKQYLSDHLEYRRGSDCHRRFNISRGRHRPRRK